MRTNSDSFCCKKLSNSNLFKKAESLQPSKSLSFYNHYVPSDICYKPLCSSLSGCSEIFLDFSHNKGHQSEIMAQNFTCLDSQSNILSVRVIEKEIIVPKLVKTQNLVESVKIVNTIQRREEIVSCKQSVKETIRTFQKRFLGKCRTQSLTYLSANDAEHTDVSSCVLEKLNSASYDKQVASRRHQNKSYRKQLLRFRSNKLPLSTSPFFSKRIKKKRFNDIKIWKKFNTKNTKVYQETDDENFQLNSAENKNVDTSNNISHIYIPEFIEFACPVQTKRQQKKVQHFTNRIKNTILNSKIATVEDIEKIQQQLQLMAL